MSSALRSSRSVFGVHKQKRTQEPTIALINIVFLMLIFFLVAATIAPPLNQELKLVSVADLEGVEPPDALVITADGTTEFRGRTLSVADYIEDWNGRVSSQRETLRIVPDRALPAGRLMEIISELRAAGAQSVSVVAIRNIPAAE